MSKIFLKISGGLGNQMFQYAFAKALSLEYDKDLLIDKTILESYPIPSTVTPRNFELDIFTLEYDEFSEINYKAQRIKGELFKKILIKTLYWKYAIQYNWDVVKQGDNDDPDSVLSKIDGKSNLMLDGYFQSEIFFRKYVDQIRQSFSFKQEPTSNSLKWLELIRESKNTVSLHIRRGDYMLNHNVSSHGLCDLSYYDNAISYLKDLLGKVNFIVFSDDIAWCKEQFISDDEKVFQFVEGNSGDFSYEDLRLMSNCQHNIIANSSFSWWGAYLNSNKNKIVCRPSQWFASNEFSIWEENTCPDRWLKF
jgi:hypothetical protein